MVVPCFKCESDSVGLNASGVFFDAPEAAKVQGIVSVAAALLCAPGRFGTVLTTAHGAILSTAAIEPGERTLPLHERSGPAGMAVDEEDEKEWEDEDDEEEEELFDDEDDDFYLDDEEEEDDVEEEEFEEDAGLDVD